MVAAWTRGGDAIGVACATGFALVKQARRVRAGRIEFNRIVMLFWAGSFASGCSPPRFTATQLPSATQTSHVSFGLGLSPVSVIVLSAHLTPRLQPGEQQQREMLSRFNGFSTGEKPLKTAEEIF
jgi:hypothetical protein